MLQYFFSFYCEKTVGEQAYWVKEFKGLLFLTFAMMLKQTIKNVDYDSIRMKLLFIDTWAFRESSLGVLDSAPFVVNVLNPGYICSKGGKLDSDEVFRLIECICKCSPISRLLKS